MKENNKEYTRCDKMIEQPIESNGYQKLVIGIYRKMRRTYNMQRQYYVINILFNKDTQETYVSQRIDERKEYYGYLQVLGGGIEYGETALEACIRETEEETGLIIEESQITYSFTHKAVDETEGKDCEVFVTEITKEDKLKRTEVFKNGEWKAYKIEELYRDHLNELTPTLRIFEKEIYQYIFKKYLSESKTEEKEAKPNKFENLLRTLNKLRRNGK